MARLSELTVSPSASSTCNASMQGPSDRQLVVYQGVPEVDCGEMLDINRTNLSIANPSEHRNIAAHVSHSTSNLLFDGDSPHTHDHRRSTSTLHPSRPRYSQRSVSLPPASSRPQLPRYVPVPLTARSTGFESLRDDHDIQFRRRIPFTALILHWGLWADEDAAPQRLRRRVVNGVAKGKGKAKAWLKGKAAILRKGL